MRLTFVGVGAAALLPLLAFATPTPVRSEPALAPLHAPVDGEHIDDSYIVVFKKGIAVDQVATHLGFVEQWHFASPLASGLDEDDTGGLNHVYMPATANFSYAGYAGKFSTETIDSIRASPEVAYVERDQVMHTLEIPQGVDDALAPSGILTERGAPWGLARISHRETLHLSTFTQYLYYKDGGEGVTAYVIDTGINIDHVEFEGRAAWGKTIPKNDVDKDGNGHGTHCAGTIASKKYGVAKAANLVAVKVLGSNGSGSMSDVLAGVVWAANKASEAAAAALQELAKTGKTKHKGSVANMSLGGGKSQSLDDAVNSAVEAGLHFAVAAGNDNKDACNYSPASAELAVTVGASTLGDERAYFSNHGKCVDIFAPGLSILSTWTGGNETTNTISGTSMASPHICGLLAYLLSIHGTETFTLLTNDDVADVTGQASYYEKAYGILPKPIQALLPVPDAGNPFYVSEDGNTVAPVPPKTISPAKLKKALIALASPGMLDGKDLPAGTPNLLAFNNATSSKSK